MAKKDNKAAKPKTEFRTVEIDSKEGREVLAEMGKKIVEELKEYGTVAAAAKLVSDFLQRRIDVIKEDGKAFCESVSQFILSEKSKEECCDEGIPSMLLKGTRFDIDRKDIEFHRAPKYDTKDSIAFGVTVRSTSEKDGCTESVSESFLLNASQSYVDTLAAFDKAIAGLEFVKFKEKGVKGPCERPKDECGKCKCKKDKMVGNAVKALTTKKALDGFKQFLLKNSRYVVPSTRFKVLFDRVDRKSQKFVYELRFFQKNYRKDETQSYEMAYLRVRINGDRDDLIVKRFDKAVSELKFNEFQEKK